MKYLIISLCILFNTFIYGQEIKYLDKVLKQIHLDKGNCKLDLVVSKSIPNNVEEVIIVIPEIVNEEEDMFELVPHIYILDKHSGTIKYTILESSKNKHWFSDALILAEVKIDTAPYIVNSNKRAFGIRLYYYTSSHPNPYSRKSISLFVVDDKKIKKILDDFTVMEYGGETDTVCYGEFFKEEKILIMMREKTNGYFNILVKNTMTDIEQDIDDTGDCKTVKQVSKNKQLLRYNSKFYK